MDKMIQTLQYLMKSLSRGVLFGFLVILGTVAVTDLVFFLTSQQSMAVRDVSLTVPFEITAGIFCLLIGMILLIADFKVALANGISRTTFLLANLPSAVITAAAFSIFNLIVVFVHGLFWPINSISDLYYPTGGGVEYLIVQFNVQFSLYLELIIIGRLVTLVNYRSNRLVKWAILITTIVLFGLLIVADYNTRDTIFVAIYDYLLWSRVFPRTLFIMLAYSAAFYSLVFLLIRRAPLKD